MSSLHRESTDSPIYMYTSLPTMSCTCSCPYTVYTHSVMYSMLVYIHVHVLIRIKSVHCVIVTPPSPPLSLSLPQPLLSLLRMIFDLIVSFREKQEDMLTVGLTEVERRQRWHEQNISRERQVCVCVCACACACACVRVWLCNSTCVCVTLHDVLIPLRVCGVCLRRRKMRKQQLGGNLQKRQCLQSILNLSSYTTSSR